MFEPSIVSLCSDSMIDGIVKLSSNARLTHRVTYFRMLTYWVQQKNQKCKQNSDFFLLIDSSRMNMFHIVIPRSKHSRQNNLHGERRKGCIEQDMLGPIKLYLLFPPVFLVFKPYN